MALLDAQRYHHRQDLVEVPVAMPEPATEVTDDISHTDPPEAATITNPDAEPKLRWSRHFHRAAGVVAVTSASVLAQAEGAAANATSAVARAQSQKPGVLDNLETKVGIGIGILGIVSGVWTGVWTRRQENKENVEKRFVATLENLGELTGDSTGEQRQARLHAFDSFKGSREYAPRVFGATLGYLRGRRSGLEKLRMDHGSSGAKAFKDAVTERRNADRDALNLFFDTLPAARRQLHKKQIGRLLRARTDKYQTLQELTGGEPYQEPPRIDAKGINLDYMRTTLKKRDLHDVDLTGAGLQELQVTNVIFANARLCQAQFEGTVVKQSDLSSADLRAANFYSAKFEKCVIDKDTKFGHLPDNHPDAFDPDEPAKYSGDPKVILKDLVSETLSPEEIIERVHEWQRNGLELLAGSNPEYFLPVVATP